MLKIMEISHIKRKRKNMNSPCPSKSANFDVMGGNSTITLYCVNRNLGKRRREDVVDDLLQVTMGTSSLMLEETQVLLSLDLFGGLNGTKKARLSVLGYSLTFSG